MQPKSKGGSCSIMNDGSDGYKFAFGNRPNLPDYLFNRITYTNPVTPEESKAYNELIEKAWADAAKGVSDNPYPINVDSVKHNIYVHEYLHAMLQHRSKLKEQLITDVDSG